MATSFLLEDMPERILTEEDRVPNSFARNFKSSLFARPSEGGALSAILTVLSDILPLNPVTPALGMTLILICRIRRFLSLLLQRFCLIYQHYRYIISDLVYEFAGMTHKNFLRNGHVLKLTLAFRAGQNFKQSFIKHYTLLNYEDTVFDDLLLGTVFLQPGNRNMLRTYHEISVNEG